MVKNIKLEEETTGAMLLLDTLIELGVDTIFGYPGGSVLPLYDAIYDHQINHILTRHEQGAVHAAEGYAKSTGKPGVVVVTSGPGATNAVTGIADAMSDSVPLIVFTGQVTTPGIGKDAFQEADMVGMTMPITKYNYQIRDTKEIPKVLTEAYHIATTGRKGPVVIDIPKDITIESVKTVSKKDVVLPSYQPTISPNKLQVKKLLDYLATAKKPLIVAGGGVNYAEGSQELVAFAEKYQIPVLSTLLGLGAMPSDHELFLGMGGMHGSYAANMALTETDFLINIGARFDDRLASAPDKFATNALVAHIDIDPAEIGKIIKTQLPIVADAKKTLKAMLAQEGKRPQDEEWVKTVKQNKQKHPFTYDRTQTAEIKPQRVVELIGKITKGDAIVVTDVGQHQMWTAQFYPVKHSKQLITSGGLGTMGFGIPAAIGAKLANPEKEVVLFVGDGGFQMTSQELAILNIYHTPIKIILLNNHSLGMVRQWQESFFGERRSESVFEEQPNFQLLAQAYGIEAVNIREDEELEEKLTEAFANKEVSTLIEVQISPTEHVLPMVPAGQPNDQMIGVE